MKLIFLLLPLLISCFSMEDTLRSADNKQEILNSWSVSIAKQYTDVKNVSSDKLKKFLTMTDRPLYIIDHRNLDEQSISMIKGATPSRDINIAELPKNARIVVYCTIGARSSNYVNGFLEGQKLEGREMYNLSGGILSWTFVGGELLTPQKEATKKLHVFGPAYNVIADGYKGITE